MSFTTWECTQPNNCTDECKLDSSVKPTGCVYSDEEDIPRDADIWVAKTQTKGTR